MKALIFGSNGQDGRFLADLLKKKNVGVIGIARSNSNINGSVADYELVDSIIRLHQPDYIFHFAANSTTWHDALLDNHAAISTGTINILEAVRLHARYSKVFLSGSALQFKNNGLPINEQTPFEASSG
jgi:GDPmannose 4,6-dehydratase